MSTAPLIRQFGDASIETHHQSPNTYRVDMHAAIEACKGAQACLQQNDLMGCERLAVKALMVRPACHLAYQTLSQLFARREQTDDSVSCRRRLLPQWLHEKYLGLQRQLDEADPASDTFDRLMVFESEQRLLPVPVNLVSQLASPFKRADMTSHAVFIDTIPNARVWHDSSNTLVLDGKGASVSDHTVGNTQLLVALAETPEPLVLQGRAVLLGARGAHNYYHWLIDIIPKLNALQTAGIEIRPDDIFIVPQAKPAFAHALLAQYGIKRQQVFEAESVSPYLQVEQLLVPHLSNTMGYTMGSWLPGELQRSMLQQPSSALQSNLKIYVSRDEKTAAGRTIGNQQEVEDFFSKCGFEIVFPERLSVSQQAHLFAKASVVAGPHGAGLSNLVYCAPGTRVFEFFGEHMAPCYWLISALAGLEYYQHYCADAQSDDRPSSAINSRALGFDISIQAAEALLQRASVI